MLNPLPKQHIQGSNLLSFGGGAVADQVVEAERKSLYEGNVLVLNGFPDEVNGLKMSESPLGEKHVATYLPYL